MHLAASWSSSPASEDSVPATLLRAAVRFTPVHNGGGGVHVTPLVRLAVKAGPNSRPSDRDRTHWAAPVLLNIAC
jgi:hypothetical protein